ERKKIAIRNLSRQDAFGTLKHDSLVRFESRVMTENQEIREAENENEKRKKSFQRSWGRVLVVFIDFRPGASRAFFVNAYRRQPVTAATFEAVDRVLFVSSTMPVINNSRTGHIRYRQCHFTKKK